MIIHDAEITMWGPYYFTVNADHVRICGRCQDKSGWKDVFWPSPVLDKSVGEWHGPEHKRIVDALNELEQAIIAAAEIQEKPKMDCHLNEECLKKLPEGKFVRFDEVKTWGNDRRQAVIWLNTQNIRQFGSASTQAFCVKTGEYLGEV